jgi:hypothetical protein
LQRRRIFTAKPCAELICSFEEISKTMHGCKLRAGVENDANPGSSGKWTTGSFALAFVSCASRQDYSFHFYY